MSFTDEDVEAARSCSPAGRFPEVRAQAGASARARRAEVAFAGRSNVGKSSLLNALTNRNGLARTSNTPGRRRS